MEELKLSNAHLVHLIQELQQAQGGAAVDPPINLPDGIDLPLSSLDNLQALEEMVKDDEDAKKAVVGTNVYSVLF